MDSLQKKWDSRIDYLRDNFNHLTEWEQDFLISMVEKRDSNFDLSPKEVHKLYEIYHKVEWKLG